MHATTAQEAIPIGELLPTPFCSSRSTGWNGVDLHVYRMNSVEYLAAHSEHLVSIQITGCEKMYQRRDGREFERALFPGDVIVTPAGSPKAWRRQGRGTVLILAIAPEFLDRMFGEATGKPGAHMELLDNFCTRDPQLTAVAELLWDEIRNGGVGSRLYAEAAITQLMVHLIRAYCAAPHQIEAPCRMPAHKLRKAKAYIEANLAEDLSVEAIARTIGMSPFHFAHAFRAATGLSPHKYVMQRRVDEAKSLLRDTGLSLTEIAQRIGYSSASHFCVGFQKLAHASPSDYRRNC